MKKKLLTKTNAVIAAMLGLMGISMNSCLLKYGPPEPMYGPPYTEEPDTTATLGKDYPTTPDSLVSTAPEK